MHARGLIFKSLIVWAVVPSIGWAQPQFQGIGFFRPPGDNPYTPPTGVSADGLVVVGWGFSDAGIDAFRWTAETGVVSLGALPGGAGGQAEGVSADGSVIVGRAGSPESSPNTQAFRWTAETGMIGLGDLPGAWFQSMAEGVSADGSIVVGMSQSDNGLEAFRWTAETGMVPLGTGCSEGDFIAGEAKGISDDGLVIVGAGAWCDNGDRECYRWTEAEGLIPIGVLLFGDRCRAYDASADGSVIIGKSDSTEGDQAFRWTQESGMVGLGDVPG